MRHRASVGQADNLDGVCVRFMHHLHKSYRGHKSEIHAISLCKQTAKFQNAFGVNQSKLLDALIRRNWLEPIGSETYNIRFDLVDNT